MEVKEVIEALSELEGDSSIPKNIKIKVSEMINNMKSDMDLSMKVNKSLSELDDISNDVNIPTFIRTQIWSIASMLEQLE